MMRRGYKFVKEGSHNYEHEHDPDTVRLLGAKAERGKKNQEPNPRKRCDGLNTNKTHG